MQQQQQHQSATAAFSNSSVQQLRAKYELSAFLAQVLVCAPQPVPLFPVMYSDAEKVQVIWQVAYDHNGVTYWWDYDANVSADLENAFVNQKVLIFNWAWGALKNGEISEYVADPEQGLVLNQATKHERKIRRVTMLV